MLLDAEKALAEVQRRNVFTFLLLFSFSAFQAFYDEMDRAFWSSNSYTQNTGEANPRFLAECKLNVLTIVCAPGKASSS